MYKSACALITAILLATLVAGATPPAERPPRALLITGNGNAIERNPSYPNWNHEFYNDKIIEILSGIVDVTVTEDLSTLTERALEPYDLIVNNSMFLTPRQEQLDAFYQFIAEGGNYLAVHAGLVSFLNSDRYESLIGGRFVAGEPSKEMEVFTFDSWYGFDYNDQVRHPITRSLPNFTIQDELYLVQTNTSALDVIARAENHPVMWWRAWGDGKAMCLTLGHSTSALNNAGYQTLLRNGVKWLVGYPLLEDIPDSRFPTNADSVSEYINLDDICVSNGDGKLAYEVVGNSDPQLLDVAIDNHNRIRLVFAPERRGTTTVHIRAEGSRGLADTSSFDIHVTEKGSGNLALYHGVSASASSNEERKFTADPGYAIDGRLETRWSSDYHDPNWLELDLGESFSIDRIRLLWEGAYGQQYAIQVSSDGKQWRTVHAESHGNGGTDEVTFDPVSSRYLRLYGTQRATPWGYSLYEFEVYGNPIDP